MYSSYNPNVEVSMGTKGTVVICQPGGAGGGGR